MAESGETIEIKLIETAEQGQFLAFLRGNLEAFDKFERFWRWRQDNKSICGGEDAAIAKYGDKVVGCVGIVPADINGWGNSARACWQQDSMVDGAMRGKGVGKRLVKKAAETWDLIFAKGTSLPMYNLRKSVGFSDVANSNYLIKVCRVRKDAGSFKKMLAERILLNWQKCIPAPRKAPDIILQRINEFDESFNTLSDDIELEKNIGITKDQRYLNWRYTKCPGKSYTILRADSGGTRGAIILNVTGKQEDEGWIVDLLCPARDKECGFTLIHEAMKFFKARNVSRIWVLATLAAKRKWFFRFGFLSTTMSPRFTYRVENSDLNLKIRHMGWDFWHGDGDLELYN